MTGYAMVRPVRAGIVYSQVYPDRMLAQVLHVGSDVSSSAQIPVTFRCWNSNAWPGCRSAGADQKRVAFANHLGVGALDCFCVKALVDNKEFCRGVFGMNRCD